MLFLKKLDKYKAYLTYIYAYYVMPSRKLNVVGVFTPNSTYSKTAELHFQK